MAQSLPSKNQKAAEKIFHRPRTAAAIIKFGAQEVVPASKAFRRGDMETGTRVFGDAVFGRGGYARLDESRKVQVNDNLKNVKAELLGSGFASLDANQVRGVQIPTLLITGERSIGLFHCMTDRLEELLPSARRIQIPDALHIMHENNASAYNAAVLSFNEANRQSALLAP